MAIRERSQDYWGSIALTAFLQDVKFGARVLARSPGVSVVVVLTIAFGAALNGVFLQLNDAFLREPDLTNADRLVWLDDGGPRTGGATYPDYVDYRDRVPAIDLAIFTGGGNAKPAGSANPGPVSVALASGNYFRVLQASAVLGRTFGPSEDLPPLGTAVAVLSDAYWARQFGRARDVLGRTIDLNFKPFLIIGVMPRSSAARAGRKPRVHARRVGADLVPPAARARQQPAGRSHDVVGTAADRAAAGRCCGPAGSCADQDRRRGARPRISGSAPRPRPGSGA